MDLRKHFSHSSVMDWLYDLDDFTAVWKGPQPFVHLCLMLDCSDASINRWHMLNIS